MINARQARTIMDPTEELNRLNKNSLDELIFDVECGIKDAAKKGESSYHRTITDNHEWRVIVHMLQANHFSAYITGTDNLWINWN